MNDQISDLRSALCDLIGDSHPPGTCEPTVSFLCVPSFSSLPSVSDAACLQIANRESKYPKSL
jgi:hypothetical protein